MRWFVDECVDAGVARLSRESGHDLIYVSDVAPRAADVEVMDRENRLLLTEDKDFGDLVFRQAKRVPGIVLLRIPPLRRALKGPRLITAIERFGETLFGRYTVIEDVRIRSRPLRGDE